MVVLRSLAADGRAPRLAEIVGAVTAGAAGLAAVFAGANLYLSGRRELNRWTRDTLVELFVAFLDASFKHGSACGVILRTSPLDIQRDSLRRAAIAAHDLELETLTRLRLLAPPQAVTAAMALLQCEYLLAAPCFLESVPPPDDPETLLEPVRRARAVLLEAARSALRLQDVSGTGRFDRSTSWREFRNALNPIAEPNAE
jgi:hypothetical protein